MKIIIVTPAPPRSRKGNRITAVRWAKILREMGHAARIQEDYWSQNCDVLVALHARKSNAAVVRFRERFPDRPIILALTGTDLYDEIHSDESAQQSLELADRLIVLQQHGVLELPKHLQGKARVIYQSVPTPRVLLSPRNHVFEVCVVGHLREVKDPFRTAQATRLLPATSKIHVLQLGGALSDEMERQAQEEERTNPRYTWIGEVPRWKALRIVSRCRLLVLTSKLEGGANVVCEALACGTPVISSHISGSVGILGEEYPGYFPYGDTQALAELLYRAETDESFYQSLQEWCTRRRELVQPEHETECWRVLLAELFPCPSSEEEV